MDAMIHNAILWMVVPPDVPWLGESPVAGTVPAQSTIHPTMLFTATTAAGVTQPGDYWCTLNVNGDPDLEVRVTMTVEPAANMGRVHGYVLDHCTGEPVTATVDITNGDPITQTQADPNGYYSAWLFAGTYPFAFSQAGYLPFNTDVTVVAGEVVTLNVDLFPDRPCMLVEPDTMSETLAWGDSATNPMTITNIGAVELYFENWETDRGWVPLVRTVSVAPAPLPPVANMGTNTVAGRTSSPGGTEVLDGAVPDAWVAAAPIPATLVRYAKAQCQEDINVTYLIGGVSNGSIVNTLYRYDAVANSWSTLAPLPNMGEGPAGTCYDGKIYVAGGSGMTYFQIYDIASNTWTQGPAMPSAQHTTGAMGAWDGKVFVIGGDDDFYPYSGSGRHL
jgi:hypothetical protein